MYIRWSLCTLYLHACQLRVTVGDSGHCCCTGVTYFESKLTPLLVDSARTLWASFCFRFTYSTSLSQVSHSQQSHRVFVCCWKKWGNIDQKEYLPKYSYRGTRKQERFRLDVDPGPKLNSARVGRRRWWPHHWPLLLLIMYIYHALINAALSAHMIHIN